MPLVRFLIHTNIFISLAALLFTLETQVQLGMKPQWHPYLFIIFFATLFEYNLHRLITVLTNKEALQTSKHEWVRNHLTAFYVLVASSVIGFVVAVIMARNTVLLTFVPIGALTVFYSLPVFKNKQSLFRLRELPFLKIFIISFVWSTITVLLPVIHKRTMVDWHVVTMILERFLFVFAITVPFDVRDMDSDKRTRLKTLPLVLGEKKAMGLAYAAVLLFMAISIVHYSYTQQLLMLPPVLLSGLSTLYFLYSPSLKKTYFYHYGILDGTMVWQGVLVVVFYYLVP